MFTEQAGWNSTRFRLCIWKVLGPNLSQYIICHDSFSVSEWYLKLGHNLFLPHAFKSLFTINLPFDDIEFEILKASLNKT
jgi:hypothetical protein